jgi:hypothetical protein
LYAFLISLIHATCLWMYIAKLKGCKMYLKRILRKYVRWTELGSLLCGLLFQQWLSTEFYTVTKFMVTTRAYPKVSGLAAWGQELHMIQLSATRCSCIAILWVNLVSCATITLCVASQRLFIVISLSIQSGNFWIHPRTPMHQLINSWIIWQCFVNFMSCVVLSCRMSICDEMEKGRGSGRGLFVWRTRGKPHISSVRMVNF